MFPQSSNILFRVIYYSNFDDIIVGTLFSTKTVSTPGDQFDFHCLDTSLTALGVQWLVNGTLLENSTLEIVFQHYSNISKTADLSFNLPLEHNVTTIQCIINFGSENVSSEINTLLLQGQFIILNNNIIGFYNFVLGV